MWSGIKNEKLKSILNIFSCIETKKIHTKLDGQEVKLT
jgi:hypothetical protein